MTMANKGEGLSPRPRGSRRSRRSAWCSWGSIPASAGEPELPPRGEAEQRVYPRVRGGACWRSDCGGAWHGLSPRPRGSLITIQNGLFRYGSIPASAGEPAGIPQDRIAARVYPRVRGGAFFYHFRRLNLPGLSPRPRGSPGHGEDAGGLGGSIPASAGEPAAPPPLTLRSRVYPRVRGGAARLDGVITPDEGLSPRPRGSQNFGCAPARRAGSIPASAGEPHRRGPAR